MSISFSYEIEKQLEEYGTYATNTVGPSMRPLFKTHRDVVVLKRVDGALKKYDVALYRIDGKYILHRVIGVRENHYVIRGDNTFIKEYVPKDKILGVMVSFNRDGKHHDVNEAGYKFYSVFWNFIYPIRRAFAAVRRILGKIKRKLFGKRKG